MTAWNYCIFKEPSSKLRNFGGGVKIFSIKNCLVCRLTTHVIPIDRPTQGEHFKYLVWCHLTFQKFFRAPWSLKTPQKSTFLPILNPKIGLWMSIKSTKWVCAHVLQDKICFAHRVIILFISTDTYDPKEVFQVPHRDWYAVRNFFGNYKSSSSNSLKSIFCEHIWFKCLK